MQRTQMVSLDWLRKNVNCQNACPVHTNSGRYASLIGEGRFLDAYLVARKPNPFASICGRICAAPCESACRRGELDAPISIRALKRFVCEKFGPESFSGEDYALRAAQEELGKNHPRRPQTVAIIGAGPAGLACAHDLAILGYGATVFEASDVPGGMFRLGIPEYRLPRDVIRREIHFIERLGVTIRLNWRLGIDFSLSDLRSQGYEAIFIAIGAHQSRDLNIPGVDADGVLRSVEFLLNVNRGFRVDIGKRVVVVGGGNVAFDVARSAMKIEDRTAEEAGDIHTAVDVARSAVRMGARKVEVICLEPRTAMPADEEEIEAALDEGIEIHTGIGPKRIVEKGGRVSAIETVDVANLFDSEGRFSPTFKPNSERMLETDSVVLAIGQKSDLSFLRDADGIRVTPQGTIEIDPETMATSAKGIYSGGDVAFGARNAINAIADGRRAAGAIHRFLSGEPERKYSVKIQVLQEDNLTPADGNTAVPRVAVPSMPSERRIGMAEVELGYNIDQAVREGRRCLKCWINTIFENDEEQGTMCILCGGCVDICPENCIEIATFGQLSVDPALQPLMEEICDSAPGALRPDSAAMIKDETKCIRCGLCALRCPVGCIEMQSFERVADHAAT